MVFRLRFDPSEVPYWAARYVAASTPVEMQQETGIEQRVVQAARARGYLTKPEFLDICQWKSRRPKRLYAQNADEFVEAATTTALSTSSEQLRIEVLRLLSGVNWPVASAILHWTHPDPYPVLDVRALWSVGVDKPPATYSFDYWWEYTLHCRRLSEECRITMRELDRALWQYAKENGL